MTYILGIIVLLIPGVLTAVLIMWIVKLIKKARRKETAESAWTPPAASAGPDAAVSAAEGTPAYCAQCGKPLAEDSRFCPFCGTPATIKAPAKVPAPAKSKKKWGRRVMIVLGLALLGFLLVRLIQFGIYLRDPEDSSASSAGSSQSGIFAGPSSADGPGTSSSSGSKPDSSKAESSAAADQWEVKSLIDGRTLSVKKGLASTLTQKLPDTSAASRSVVLPELQAWSDGAFYTKFPESAEGGVLKTTYYFKSSGASSYDMIQEYVQLLQDRYGVTLSGAQTFPGYIDSYHDWALDLGSGYTGKTVKGLSLSGDLCITDYSDFFTFAYTDALGFADSGERWGGTTVDVQGPPEPLANQSGIRYEPDGALDIFYIQGFWTNSGDYVRMVLNQGTDYQTGDVFDLSDHQSQANTGINGLYWVTIDCDDLLMQDYLASKGEEIQYFRDARVEIVERSPSVTVIHYYYEVEGSGNVSQFEGLFAVATGSGGSLSSGGGDDLDPDLLEDFGVGKKEDKCFKCKGLGEIECTVCHASGYGDCTHCSYGESYDFLTNTYDDCAYCHGGLVDCWKCKGRQYIDCPNC